MCIDRWKEIEVYTRRHGRLGKGAARGEGVNILFVNNIAFLPIYVLLARRAFSQLD